MSRNLRFRTKIAGLLCAAIISDTLMFRSPTCTLQDKMAAGALALIADISIEEFAREMFKAGSNLKDKAPEEIFYQDYKKFIAEGDICFRCWSDQFHGCRGTESSERKTDSVHGQRMWHDTVYAEFTLC